MKGTRTRRAVRRDPRAVSPVVASILLVAITVILAAVLYVMVAGLLSSAPRLDVMTFNLESRGENVSLQVVTVSPGKVPSQTYLLIRDAGGNALLPLTPWANFTFDRWAENRVLYQDANPAVEDIRPGDVLLVSVVAYPSGSTVFATDGSSILGSRTL